MVYTIYGREEECDFPDVVWHAILMCVLGAERITHKYILNLIDIGPTKDSMKSHTRTKPKL